METHTPYFVYVIRSEKDGRLYKGMSQNYLKRLAEHNNGKVRSTKGFTPWQLVYLKEFTTRLEAREYEKWLKTGNGRDFLNNHLNNSKV